MTTLQIEMNKKFTREVVDDFTTHRAQDHPAVPCLVFLYRSVFSETGIFDELEPYAANYRVEFFDPTQRRDYLRRYLESKGDKGKQLVPMVGQFLDGFENRAEAANPQADAFFGHAIVLSAFGDFLMAQEEANVYRLAQNLEAEGVSEAASVSILCGVIDTIINREVAKFPVLPSPQPLGHFEPFDRRLQEQILGELATASAGGLPLDEVRAVVDRLGREKLKPCLAYAALSEGTQQQVAQDYIENLCRKVELHPFVDVQQKRIPFKNPIYQEYYLARYVAERPGLPFEQVNKSDEAPSYFLALFLLAQVKDRDLTAYPDATFYVLRLLSAACNGDEYQIHIDYDSDSGLWRASVESDNLRVHPFIIGRDQILSLEIPANAVFQNFSVDGGDEGLVYVRGPEGYRTDEPVMLSNGSITGEEVELDTTAVTFESVTLNVAKLSLADRVSQLNGLDTVTLDWKGVPCLHASDYARNRWGRALTTPEDIGDPQAFQVKLKRILLWFRKHGKADYAVYRVRFYTCATNKQRDKVAVRIVEFLFSTGLLRDGSLIVLNQDKLAEYGVYYVKQNELRFGPAFDRLFQDWQAFSGH